MNNGQYGYPLPPNRPTRVAPSEWKNSHSYFTPGTYNNFTVPQNTYQILAVIIGGGGGGGGGVAVYTGDTRAIATGGGAGACAFAIMDVIPGQKLPSITVGSGGSGGNTGSTNSATAFG